jgi:hypothetical protein
MKIFEILEKRTNLFEKQISFYRNLEEMENISSLEDLVKFLEENQWQIEVNRKDFVFSTSRNERHDLVLYHSSNRCIENFYDHVSKNQQNIHFPKLFTKYDFRKIRGLIALEIEKLEKVRNIDIDDANFYAWLLLYGKMKKYASHFPNFSFEDVEKVAELKSLADYWQMNNRALANTILALKNVLKNCELNFSSTNIRRRGNEWVIVFPDS